MNQLEGGNILEYVNPYLQVITEVLLIKPTNHKGGKGMENIGT